METERLQEIPSQEQARKTQAWNQAQGAFHEALVSACPCAWLLRLAAAHARGAVCAERALPAHLFATVQIIQRSPQLA